MNFCSLDFEGGLSRETYVVA